MSFTLSARSQTMLQGVHPDLQKVAKLAAQLIGDDLEFVVTEGLRTLMRQQQLMAAGATRTMKSRHLDGHAIDLAAVVAGDVRWDWPLYHRLAEVMKRAAAQLQQQIEWGGDWASFPDGPHFQLPWASYPSSGA